MRHRRALRAWFSALLVAGTVTVTVDAAERDVVVVSPSEHDARLVFFREAVAFWNRVFQELALDVRLVERSLLVDPPETQTLENYTRLIWQQAGRMRSGSARPDAPEELIRLGGDTLVFLSVQPTMSFAWPLPETPAYFIAIPREPGSRRNRGGSTRNVIAHELGHSLGLVHHRHPTVLMCSPCRTLGASTDENGFLPLTELDRQRLRQRFGR